MKIGVVISGGDVTGINNFIFQVARLAQADIVLFNGGIPGLLANQYQSVSHRDLVDYSISSMPIMSSGRTTKKLVAGEYETISKQLKTLHIEVLIMAGGDGSLQFFKYPQRIWR